jgi:hypothetical protein
VRGAYDPALPEAQVGNGVQGSASYIIRRHVRPDLSYRQLEPNADVADDRAVM